MIKAVFELRTCGITVAIVTSSELSSVNYVRQHSKLAYKLELVLLQVATSISKIVRKQDKIAHNKNIPVQPMASTLEYFRSQVI